MHAHSHSLISMHAHSPELCTSCKSSRMKRARMSFRRRTGAGALRLSKLCMISSRHLTCDARAAHVRDLCASRVLCHLHVISVEPEQPSPAYFCSGTCTELRSNRSSAPNHKNIYAPAAELLANTVAKKISVSCKISVWHIFRYRVVSFYDDCDAVRCACFATQNN